MQFTGKSVYPWFVGFLVLLTLSLPQITQANNEQVYEVQSNLLNIRTEPSLDSEVIGWLNEGDTVNGFKEKYGWVQTYYGGDEVWVAKHHLRSVHTSNEGQASGEQSTQNTDAGTNTIKDAITVTADGVYIRQGPSTAHAVVSTASSGKQFSLIQTEGDWHQIQLENGNSGYIASWLTDQPAHSTETAEKTETKTKGATTEADSSDGDLSGYTIVVDPGHGGHDPGAIGLGDVYEKDLVTSTASTVADQLSQAGAQVIETRTGDYFVPLDERAQISNSHDADAFISLHYDSYPVLTMQGMSAHYYGDSGYQLASSLQQSIGASTNLHNRGVLYGDYRVLRDTEAPAALLELGFITNSHDLSVAQTEDFKTTVAQAITDGLISYFH